ncbi:MAG TPA: hypothetical protein ENN97_10160 [Phycisphaerales bacterium]|nr:hypothetical protein [Phycisphaerales bacterium]
MLSYLKEGQSKIPAVEASSQENGAEAPSLQNDFLTVSGHTRKLRQSTMMLMAMFAVGALGVWFMIKKTTPASVAAATAEDQTQLEAAIAQLSGMQTEMNSQMDSVVGRFYEFSNIGQIHVDELQKNPFKREIASGQPGSDEDRQRQEQLRLMQDKISGAAQNLQLWSITSTPRGVCCMINDKILYVGDEINDLTVSHIGANTVDLTYEGLSIQLKMDE